MGAYLGAPGLPGRADQFYPYSGGGAGRRDGAGGGHNFTFENPVLHGDARGRTIGYPTINQQYPDGLVLPKFGVYESRILVGDTWYRGFTNIGVRPTWQVETPLAETHIFDYNGDLYGQTVQVELVRYLRPEQKFSSIGALREQLDHDKSSIL